MRKLIGEAYEPAERSPREGCRQNPGESGPPGKRQTSQILHRLRLRWAGFANTPRSILFSQELSLNSSAINHFIISVLFLK